MDPYETLEINRGASREEIKRAYRKQVKLYHPDKHTDNPLSHLAEQKMKEINEAYNILKDNASSVRFSQSSSNRSSSSNANSKSYDDFKREAEQRAKAAQEARKAEAMKRAEDARKAEEARKKMEASSSLFLGSVSILLIIMIVSLLSIT
ncbi:MAG: DnaJ domain-containing protein [Clostridiales Family XIII bacterium]|jgi:molecular chaperone DnaJ|nr:DnaJ domain-containing protein [Clostridiales Family XIII bacterium]